MALRFHPSVLTPIEQSRYHRHRNDVADDSCAPGAKRPAEHDPCHELYPEQGPHLDEFFFVPFSKEPASSRTFVHASGKIQGSLHYDGKVRRLRSR